MERGDEEGRGRADIIVCEAYLHLQTPDSSYFFVRTMCYLLKAVKKNKRGGARGKKQWRRCEEETGEYR